MAVDCIVSVVGLVCGRSGFWTGAFLTGASCSIGSGSGTDGCLTGDRERFMTAGACCWRGVTGGGCDLRSAISASSSAISLRSCCNCYFLIQNLIEIFPDDFLVSGKIKG